MRPYINILLLLFFVIPATFHIYAETFRWMYFGNGLIRIGLLLFAFSFIGYKVRMPKEIWFFVPFLSVIAIGGVLGPKTVLSDLVKYLMYIICYFWVFKDILAESIYYRTFVNAVSIMVGASVLIYLLCLGSTFYYGYAVQNLSFIPGNSPLLNRLDWDYTFPLYLTIFPKNIFENGILGVPRFFGFSAEPTLFNCICLPALLIAVDLRKRLCASVLFVAMLLSSSFSALSVLAVLIFARVFHRFRKVILLGAPVIFVILVAIFLDKILAMNSERLISYAGIFQASGGLALHPFATTSIDSDYTQTFSAILGAAVSYGYLILPAFTVILYYFYGLANRHTKKTPYYLFFGTVFMLMKGGEVLSLLLLFYLNYLNVDLPGRETVARE